MLDIKGMVVAGAVGLSTAGGVGAGMVVSKGQVETPGGARQVGDVEDVVSAVLLGALDARRESRALRFLANVPADPRLRQWAIDEVALTGPHNPIVRTPPPPPVAPVAEKTHTAEPMLMIAPPPVPHPEPELREPVTRARVRQSAPRLAHAPSKAAPKMPAAVSSKPPASAPAAPASGTADIEPVLVVEHEPKPAIPGPPPPPPPPRRVVATGSLTVDDAVDPSMIHKVLAQHRGELDQCYAAALRTDPRAAGEVEIEWYVRFGKVVAVGLPLTSDGLEGVASCVTSHVKRWQFPAEAAGVITAPISFRTEPGTAG